MQGGLRLLDVARHVLQVRTLQHRLHLLKLLASEFDDGLVVVFGFIEQRANFLI